MPANDVEDAGKPWRNEKLDALWAEAVQDMRANGLQPSERLLGYIEANIRGEMTVQEIFERVIAETTPPSSAQG